MNNMPKVQIEVIPGKDRIPSINYMEDNIPEGDTWAFLNDGDGIIYSFTMDYGELVLYQCKENISVEDMLAEIETNVEENKDSRDLEFKRDN